MTDQAKAQGVIPHLVVRDAAAALEFYKNGHGCDGDDASAGGRRQTHPAFGNPTQWSRVFVRDHFPEHCSMGQEKTARDHLTSWVARR